MAALWALEQSLGCVVFAVQPWGLSKAAPKSPPPPLCQFDIQAEQEDNLVAAGFPRKTLRTAVQAARDHH